MRLFKFFPFTVFICTLYISFVVVNGGKTRRNVNVENTLTPRATDFLGQGEQYKRYSGGKRESWTDQKQGFDSTVGSGREHKDCKDCDENEGNRDRILAPREISSSRSQQPQEIYIRVRVLPRKNHVTGRQWRKPVVYSATPSKFTNLLGRRVRKLKMDWERLTKKLFMSENKDKIHEASGNSNFRNDEFSRFTLTRSPSRQMKNGYESIEKEKSILMKTVRKTSNYGLPGFGGHQYNSKIRAHSELEPKVRSGYHSKVSPKRKVQKYSYDEAMPQIQDWKAPSFKTDDDSSYWMDDDNGGMFGGNKLVRPVMADILENSGTSLLTTIHKLRKHAHAMMKAFLATEHQLSDYYQVIENSTLNVILPGVRDATELIHEANEHILDAMKSAYRITARESFRGRLMKGRQRNSSNSDEKEIQALSMIEQIKLRDFRDELTGAVSVSYEIQLLVASIHAFQIKCTEQKAAVERLRKLFDSRDYFVALRDLRENLNDVIGKINTKFLNTPSLRRLRYRKVMSV
ncbi:hypothetical protein ElyMa_003238600 [Elysia marginata]|uniref:Uncharacterized protein n=1 Tax=Elysia marginata TaxID=1093978 RepID=A0AAV4J6Z8_9GAST|nr:hypothetical protein ElyMa_003238600 [Elysia marginata]